MLRSLQKTWSHWPGAALFAVALIFLYVIARSPSFKTCYAQHEQYASYKQQQESFLGLSWVVRNAKVCARCAGDFADRNHGPLTAIATLLLALFTTTLWWATRKLVNHAPQIERAYISGGGAFTAQQLVDTANNRVVITPVDPFQVTVDNYGKTPARVIHVEIGFCNASNIPPVPQYAITTLFNGSIPPGRSGHLTGITFPRAQITGDVIFGRFHYWDIFRERMRYSGFILRINPQLGVEPINAPAAYTDWN
jgi:hypothetical protein